MAKKIYLGDSVYLQNDGFHLILTTENGIGASNTIALDSDVVRNFIKYKDLVELHELISENTKTS